MRKLFALLSVLFVFNAPGAIKYFTDYPVNANPSNSFALPMDTGDHALGGVPYNYITLIQFAEWLQSNGFTNSSGTFISIITNNIFVTTNITVEVPGGVTNLNLTPKSLMWSDVNDAEASIPNAAGFLTNNGTGGIGWSTVLEVTQLDAQDANLTNIFTFLTNAPLLSTDGDGKIQAGNFLVATNNDTVVSNGLYAQIVASGPANLADATNHDWVIGQNNTNNSITVSNNLIASLNAALVSPTNKFGGDGSGLTNLTYKYTTNIVGAANFVFGKAYWTNVTGNFTFPALTIDPTAMETLSVWVTNSGASTLTATINGVAGAPGHVVPAVFYCTNATVTEIDLSHFGVLWTNACVSKN